MAAVPDLFISNCHKSMTEEDMKQHIEAHQIGVECIKTASHKDARRKSFTVTVRTYEDYNKLISGDYFPEHIGVRKYIYRRSTPQSRANDMQKSLIDIENLADFRQGTSGNMSTQTSQTTRV